MALRLRRAQRIGVQLPRARRHQLLKKLGSRARSGQLERRVGPRPDDGCIYGSIITLTFLTSADSAPSFLNPTLPVGIFKKDSC